MNHLRQYIRCVLFEGRFKQMVKDKYRDLDSYLKSSEFMKIPADENQLDFDFDGDEPLTVMDAADQLKYDLEEYLNNSQRFKGLSGKFNVNVEVAGDVSNPANSGKLERALLGANYDFDGTHNLNLTVGVTEPGLSYGDLGTAFVSKMAQVIRHELLHMNQFLKFSKGTPTVALYDEFVKSYENVEVGTEGYYTFDEGFSEKETFSHQIADELSSSVGKERGLEMLRSYDSFDKDLSKISKSYSDVTKSMKSLNNPGLQDIINRSIEYLKLMR